MSDNGKATDYPVHGYGKLLKTDPEFEEKLETVSKIREKLTEIEPLIQKAIDLGLRVELKSDDPILAIVPQKAKISLKVIEVRKF
jgi:hypothetical protein